MHTMLINAREAARAVKNWKVAEGPAPDWKFYIGDTEYWKFVIAVTYDLTLSDGTATCLSGGEHEGPCVIHLTAPIARDIGRMAVASSKEKNDAEQQHR
jgi:hypothetical protein